MPDLLVTMPDGRKARWSGDHPPTADDLDALYKTTSSPGFVGPVEPSKPADPTFLRRGGYVPEGAPKSASMKPDSLARRVGRAAYSELPMIGATTGAALASAPFVAGAPFTAGASAMAAPVAGLAGAGAGSLIGSGVQHIISRLTGLDAPQTAPGDEATKQMALQAGGEAVGSVVGAGARAALGKAGLSKGVALGKESAEVANTNAAHGLGLSTPEITKGTYGSFAQTAGTRGTIGKSIQAKIRQKGDEAASNAVGRILDTFGPETTDVLAGSAAQDTATGAASKASKRVEGAIGTKISPASGKAATGRNVTEGIGAARKGFSAVQKEYDKIIEDGPPINLVNVQQPAWQIFKKDILPVLDAHFVGDRQDGLGRTIDRLNKASSYPEASRDLKTLLQSPMAREVDSKILKTLNRVFAGSPSEPVPFRVANALAIQLRQAGRSPDTLLGDQAQGIATQLNGVFRKHLAEEYPAWDAARAAYGPNAQLFQSKLVKKLISDDPEAVLPALGDKQGALRSSRIFKMRRLLLDMPTKTGNPEDVESGKKAWDALRAGWLRRDVFQGDVLGLSERVKKIEPEVLRAWFPDSAGKDVVKRVQDAGAQFESQAIRDLATTDPSKILSHVGATPSRVSETRKLLESHPETGGPQSWRLLQRAKAQELVGDDPSKIADRIGKLSQEEHVAWFPDKDDRAAIDDLRKIGTAMKRRTPVPAPGLYKALEYAHIGGALLTGKIPQAMTAAGLYEGVPALLTWSIYNPGVRRMILQGVQADDPKLASTLLLRAVDAYRQSKQRQAAPQ